MKKWNRVLAMLLATVMLLAVLPMNVFADAWLDANVNSGTNGNTTSTDVTLTLDAAALLTYLKTGDKAGLLSGLNLGELKDAFTKEELNGIFPSEKVTEILSDLIEGADVDQLLQLVDVDALLKSADTDALVEQIENLPNLEDYISDYDALMGYIGEEDLLGTIDYIDINALVNDYSEELVPLVLSLNTQAFFDFVNVERVLQLGEIELSDVVDMDYLRDTVGISTLFENYVDKTELCEYVQRAVLSAEALVPYIDFTKLQLLVNTQQIYNNLKPFLYVDRLYDSIRGMEYSRLNEFVDETRAEALIVDQSLIGASDLDGFMQDGTLDMASLLQSDLMTDAVYEVLIDENAIDVLAMIQNENAPLNVPVLHEKGILNLQMFLFGDATRDEFYSIAQIYEAGALDLEAMMSDPNESVFTLSELCTNNIILVNSLRSDYGDDLIDLEVLKTRINALSDKMVLMDCVSNYRAVAREIGISEVVEATCGSYGALIDDYVDDVAGLMNAIGVQTVLNKIISDGQLNKVFNVGAIVRAVEKSEWMEIVDWKAIVNQLRTNGTWKDALKLIDSDQYISALTAVLGVLEKNISEITINDIAVTKKDGNLLFINTANLAAVLEEILPELEDIAAMGDDGKVFSLNASVTYRSEQTENAEMTKALTVNVLLDGGVEQIRSAAAKLKAILDRFVTYDFKDGILHADFTLPSKFATVIKVALEKMETSDDAELQALKDRILELYDANANDVTAFIDGLTLEQIVALFNAVDASVFDTAYGEVMTNAYVQLLLDYIKEATGKDFTDLTAADLMIRAGDLPTLESLCEKIEAKLGQEISAFDRLPDGDPVEILNRLAEKVGVTDRYGQNVDFAQLLRDAAKQEAPLEYLYEEVVALIENNRDAYELIQNKVVSVLEKLLASQVGDRLNTLHLSDLYRGEGVFQYDAKLEYRPVALMQKGIDRAISALAAKLPIGVDAIESAARILLSYFTDDTLNLGVDLSVKVNGLYRISFYDENAQPIRSMFLPEGTELALMQSYASATESPFKGWMDVLTHEYYEYMPAADVHVIADVEDGTHSVFVVDPDSHALVGEIKIPNGESLAQYRDELDDMVRTYLNAPSLLSEEIVWFSLKNGNRNEFTSWNTVLESNLTLTWELPATEVTYQVQIFDPNRLDGAPIYTLTVREGTVLSDAQLQEIRDFIREYANISDETPDEDLILTTVDTNQDYDLTAPINGNISLTWRMAEYYTVTLVDWEDTASVLGSWLIRENTKLKEWNQYNQMTALRGTAPQYYQYLWVQVKDGVVTNETFNEESVVTADLTLTWKQVYADELVTIEIKAYDASQPYADRETVLTLENVQKGTALKAYLESVAYNADLNCYEWLMSLTEESNPAIVDYVHTYQLSWNDVDTGADMGSIDSYIICKNLTFTWNYTKDYESAGLTIMGGIYNGSDEDHYSIYFADGYWNVVWNGSWGDVAKELVISKTFLQQIGENAENIHGVILSASASVHKIQLSNQMLKTLWSLLKETNFESVSLRYAPTTTSSYNANSGASAFTLDFYFGHSAAENAQKVDAGRFDNSLVQVTVPFDVVEQGEDQKTFLIVDGEEEIEFTYVTGISVTFSAPHFSTFELVNKYKVYHNNNYDASSLPEELRGDLPSGQIASYPIDATYYEKGYEFHWDSIDPVNGITAIKVDQIRLSRAVNGTAQQEITLLNSSGTYVMPDYAITLQHIAQIAVYHVFYYVNGALLTDRTISYTAFTDVEELRTQIGTLPEGYDATAGWAWFELEDLWANCYAQSDINLFLVNASATDKKVNVNFYNGTTLLNSQTYSVSELADRTNLPTVGSLLGWDSSNVSKAAYWVDANGKRLNDYTLAEWNTAIRSGTLNVYAAYADRIYMINTDGNVTVTVNGTAVISAVANTKIQLKIRQMTGMVTVVTVKDSANAVVAFDSVNGTFVMPESDVTILVTYTSAMIDYVDANGQNASDAYGTIRTLPAITIPAGTIWNRDAVSSDLVLVSLTFDGKNMIAVYSYVLVETVDERTLIASVQDTLKQAVYQNKYLVNGQIFYDADQALASISGNADFKEWSNTFSNTVLVACFAPVAEDLTPSLLVLCIVLIIVILILLIALFYVLYITGKLKPNLFLKVITAIVSAFYAVCMAVAAAGLAIAKFFGYREEDLVEEYPEEDLAVEEPLQEDAPLAETEEKQEETDGAITEQTTETPAAEESDGAIELEVVGEELATNEETVEPLPQDESDVADQSVEEQPEENFAETPVTDETVAVEPQAEDIVSDEALDADGAAEAEPSTTESAEELPVETEQQAETIEVEEIVSNASEAEEVAEEVVSEPADDVAESVSEMEDAVGEADETGKEE